MWCNSLHQIRLNLFLVVSFYFGLCNVGGWGGAGVDRRFTVWGSLGGAAVWRLPLAQGAILETRDRIPCRAPSAWSLLLPLPASLSVTIINKKIKK